MTNDKHLEALKAELAFKKRMIKDLSLQKDLQREKDDIFGLETEIESLTKLAKWEASQELIRSRSDKKTTDESSAGRDNDDPAAQRGGDVPPVSELKCGVD